MGGKNAYLAFKSNYHLKFENSPNEFNNLACNTFKFPLDDEYYR